MGGSGLPWRGGRPLFCITVHIVPGDWAGWPWRQRLKPHLCSASSQGSMEPPRPQGSRFTALAAGCLVPLGRLHSTHPALCRADPGNWQQEQEGGRAARWKRLGHRQAEGRLPSARPPASPVAARVTQASPVAGPMAAFQPAAPLSLSWAQPALRMPLRPSANCGRPLCALHQVSTRGCQGAKFLSWDSGLSHCPVLHTPGLYPPGDLQEILGRPEGLELRSRTCVPLPPFPRWAPQLPGPATAPHPQILREGPRAGAVHTVRAGFKYYGKPQTEPTCPDCVRRMGRKFQYSSPPPPRPVPCVLSTLLLREVGAGESSTAEAQIQKS